MESKELRDGFIRQRRNLIISSLVLFFSQVTDLKIETLNVFGNTIKLEHPLGVTTAILIATVYWFFRYYQYFTELDRKKIQEAFTTSKNMSVIKSICSILSIKFQKELIPPPNQNISKIRISLSEFEIKHLRVYLVKPVLEVQRKYSEHFERLKEFDEVKVVIKKRHLAKAYVFAIYRFCFLTTKFSEYILPFILFTLPLVYGLLHYL